MKKSTLMFLFGVALLVSWLILSVPFLGSYAHINPGPEPSSGYGSGYYLLGYPAILLWLLIFGIAFLTFGISQFLLSFSRDVHEQQQNWEDDLS